MKEIKIGGNVVVKPIGTTRDGKSGTVKAIDDERVEIKFKNGLMALYRIQELEAK